jgi:hypothetical protein
MIVPVPFISIKATNINKLAVNTSRFLSRLDSLLRVILSAYLVNESSWIKDSVSYFCKEVRRLTSERGIEFTVKYVKTSRNCVMRALSGHPLTSVDGISLDSKGIPK